MTTLLSHCKHVRSGGTQLKTTAVVSYCSKQSDEGTVVSRVEGDSRNVDCSMIVQQTALVRRKLSAWRHSPPAGEEGQSAQQL